MRILAALAALMLLAGCDEQPAAPGGADASGSAQQAAAWAQTGSGFDFRYAFRLPGDRVKEVLRSNADGCEQLGPARCRILAQRYTVDDASHTRAVLTLSIDPAIARTFGDAAVKTLQSAGGLLVDSEISGADTTTNARTLAIVDRLRDRLKAAQALPATDPTAKAQVTRTQSALDAVIESESGDGQTLATVPVLITYESSSALTGLGSADANFRSAGKSLEYSLSRALVVLAAIGPWLLALLVLIVLLRYAVHGRSGGFAAPPPAEHEREGERAHPASHEEHRNLIRRWFAHGDDLPEHHEPEPAPQE